MKIEVKELFTIINPKEGYRISNLDKTEMYEGSLYLGKHDVPENYIEVINAEYEEWKIAKELELKAKEEAYRKAYEEPYEELREV